MPREEERHESGELSKHQTIQGLIGQSKEFEFRISAIRSLENFLGGDS